MCANLKRSLVTYDRGRNVKLVKVYVEESASVVRTRTHLLLEEMSYGISHNSRLRDRKNKNEGRIIS